MQIDRHETMRQVLQSGIIAVIRADSAFQALDICRALADGGVIAWEIAMTTPGALQAIEKAAEALGGHGHVGVGTVLDASTAVAAIHAGAQFVFSPIIDPQIIEAAHRYGRAVIPGALTPTEIVTAWSAGADVVKVFPANQFSPSYFRDLSGPLPHIKLAPTGGVDLETVDAWIQAGAVALGVGSALVPKDLVRAGDWTQISALAARYIEAVRKARVSRHA